MPLMPVYSPTCAMVENLTEVADSACISVRQLHKRSIDKVRGIAKGLVSDTNDVEMKGTLFGVDHGLALLNGRQARLRGPPKDQYLF